MPLRVSFGPLPCLIFSLDSPRNSVICVIGVGATSSLMFGIPIAVIKYFLWSYPELTGTWYSFVLMVPSSPLTFAMVTKAPSFGSKTLHLGQSNSAVSDGIRLT